jgi:hypothetical protein
VKLQWFVPGAAGVVVIGAPAASNFVHDFGVTDQIARSFLLGVVYDVVPYDAF